MKDMGPLGKLSRWQMVQMGPIPSNMFRLHGAPGLEFGGASSQRTGSGGSGL